MGINLKYVGAGVFIGSILGSIVRGDLLWHYLVVGTLLVSLGLALESKRSE